MWRMKRQNRKRKRERERERDSNNSFSKFLKLFSVVVIFSTHIPLVKVSHVVELEEGRTVFLLIGHLTSHGKGHK